jgi:hypothetical protein
MIAESSPVDLVIASTAIITVTTIIRNAHNKTKAGTTFEPIVFGFLLCIALLVIALVAPGIAKGLALLGLVGAFAVNGPALFSIVGGLGK